MEYKFNFDVWKLDCDPFKDESLCSKIINTIRYSRIGKHVGFDTYADLTFEGEDADKHWHPIVRTTETFNKKKTNCIVFNMDADNEHGFDKMFLYRSTHASGQYGFAFVNTSTNYVYHRYYISDDIAYLISTLNQAILLIY